MHQCARGFSEETPELKRELPELFTQRNKAEVEENGTQPSALCVGVPAPDSFLFTVMQEDGRRITSALRAAALSQPGAEFIRRTRQNWQPKQNSEPMSCCQNPSPPRAVEQSTPLLDYRQLFSHSRLLSALCFHLVESNDSRPVQGEFQYFHPSRTRAIIVFLWTLTPDFSDKSLSAARHTSDCLQLRFQSNLTRLAP